jgi:hypothetical protein
MATVEEVFGKMPRMEFDTESLKSLMVDVDKVWVNYNEEADSMIMFFTGEPVGSVAVLMNDNFYVMVDPKTKKAVGVQFECWEKKFVPAFKPVKKAWPEVKTNLASGWSYTLQMLMLWLITAMRQHPENNRMLPQLA